MQLTRSLHSSTVVCALGFSFALLGLSAFAPHSRAGFFTLVDDNSTTSLNTASPANMLSWVVDGVNHLEQQAFWFRIGNVAETSLHTLPIAVEGTTDTDFDGNHEHLYVRYNAAGLFFAEVNYALDGGSIGSGASDVGEQITITSTTSLPLDFHFFQYVDLEINATPGNDLGFFPDPHSVIQYDGSLTVSETADAPEPDHREMDFYNGILAKLTDGDADTLSDTPEDLVFGPGDLTWAFQWDFTLAPFGSFQISKDKIISVVPEPATIALLGFGAGLLLCVRRKR